MYKVFINDKPIILTDSLQNQNELPFFIYKDVVLDEVFHKLEVGLLAGAYLYALDIETSWNDFRTYFKVVVAGGGLVLNAKNEVLFIYRGGKWDLPKGRIEEGESIEETAVREVEEECGISNLTLDRFLLKTHHVFYQNKVRKLKETYWYLMHSNTEQELTPQEEEGITIAEFKQKSEITIALENSYANIQLVIDQLDT
ncbi:NUDIX domain-containing protein [Flavobacteriaceae bacterium S356]|uniref:NUDIX domain-containing protein n=1 Tax=Asprobacillus argus TaxID=3076534 RepID=A0ABU3LGJ0_9FLAO|nr:NUDIX domain-containing protein [Flavobacteriaceae bacterium S356]